MGFDRKMDSKVDSKPVWEASPPPFSFTVHFTVHPTTDSTYHTVRPLGRRQSTETRRGKSRVDQEKLAPCPCLPHLPKLDHSLAIVAHENHGTTPAGPDVQGIADHQGRNGDWRGTCLGRSPTASKASFNSPHF